MADENELRELAADLCLKPEASKDDLKAVEAWALKTGRLDRSTGEPPTRTD